MLGVMTACASVLERSVWLTSVSTFAVEVMSDGRDRAIITQCGVVGRGKQALPFVSTTAFQGLVFSADSPPLRGVRCVARAVADVKDRAKGRLVYASQQLIERDRIEKDKKSRYNRGTTARLVPA